MKNSPLLMTSCILFVFSTSVLFADDLKHTTDSLQSVKSNISEKKAVLIDVREKSEWDAGHIEGAVFLPLSELKSGTTCDTLEKLPKDKFLYTYCKVGVRSLTAGNLLAKLGYQVRVLKPGYQDLLDAGFSKETK
jgi:rhodanese-related sulfurtransferase